MANSQSIKKKFLDILFEPDDEEEKKVQKSNTSVNNDNAPLKATDLLYGKKTSKSSAFINLADEVNKEDNTEDVSNSEEKPFYTSSPNLSPIFGNIDSNKKKKTFSTNGAVDFAYTDKPNGNYLDMVMSPIYGYDTNSANEARSKLDLLRQNHFHDNDITEDLSDIFSTDEFKQEINNSEPEINNSEIDLFSSFDTKEDK